MKLSRLRIKNLARTLDRVPPAKVEDLKAVRALDETVEYLLEFLSDYNETRAKLMEEAEELTKEDTKKLEELQDKYMTELDEEKRFLYSQELSILSQETNNKIKPQNEALEALEKTISEDEVEFELEHLETIQEIFKTQCIKSFNNRKAFLEICDILGIE